MKYRDTRVYQSENKNKRDFIKEDLFECYEKLCKGEDVSHLIKSHRRFINNMQLNGNSKKKYKTLDYLVHYRNTKNKVGAMINLTNAIYGIHLFKKSGDRAM